MELWIGALNLGFLYAFMTMGVFITFRIHDFPDITVDGSFTSGAAAAALLITAGVDPLPALIAAFAIGAAAGAVTAFIHTRFSINGLLAGILVMTGLYSINLHIMGRSNIPLLNQVTFLTHLERINPGLPMEVWVCVALLAMMVVFWLLVSLFFKTDLGISMRATGNNRTMAAAAGVNVAGMTIFGVALANGLVGVSGGLVAQYQGFADIGMGIGTVVIGLASVIIGESLIRMRSLYATVLSVIVGSVLFRMMIAGALFIGMNPIDLKLLTAAFVLVTLVTSKAFAGRVSGEGRAGGMKARLPLRRVGYAAGLAVVAGLAWWGYKSFTAVHQTTPHQYKIGVLQITDHGLLNITRDSFVGELQRLGYKQGEHCTVYLENANGDLPTVNTILDKFLQEKMDVVVPISTSCTQAAINKIKDRPVVFATVANPFIIGAGTSETEHLPNVTGVYGWVPMDKTVELVRSVLPGPLKIGSIWDPAHANSVFNAEALRDVVKTSSGLTFAGETVGSSAEVYQAALSLAQKDIDAFVLVPDNIVYSAFESVVKAAAPKKIPIFLSDVERLADGALGALGYDYTSSGIQAARLVDRILKGESPRSIPFERYSRLTVGINMEVAKRMGLSIPAEVLARAGVIYDGANKPSAPTPDSAREKRLALFAFGDQSALEESSRGIMQELEESGILQAHNIQVDRKNAQNEFHLAQSIAQDMVRLNYDYIITVSTPALQVTAQFNKRIPHVFGCVTDPYRMGVAQSPDHHLPNVTGVATLQPVDQTVAVMRRLFPDAKTIGMVWNPAEACSEACTLAAREAAKKHGFELVEATVSRTSEVLDALNSLINKDVDLFLTSGDNTVNMAISSIAEVLKRHRIPYFTNELGDIERGSLVSLGADYREVGRKTAQVAIRVIKGEDPRSIPILNFTPDTISINEALANDYGLTLPADLVQRAAKIRR